MLLQMALCHFYGKVIFHCVWVCVCVCVCVCDIYVPSCVWGPLGCICVLGIANSAAVSIGVHVIFSNQSFLWIDAQEWDCWIIW